MSEVGRAARTWWRRAAEGDAAAFLAVLTVAALAVAALGTQNLARAETVKAVQHKPIAKVVLAISGDADLKGTLSDASALVRNKDKPLPDAETLVRRARGDIDTLVGTLYAAARYGGTVRITVAGVSALDPGAFDAAAAAVRRGPIPVTIKVVTGPKFTFGKVRFVNVAHGRGMPLLKPAAVGLTPGAPALSTDVLNAEKKIVDVLRAQGRALAKVVGRDTVADHTARQLNVTFRIDPGPPAAFGAVTVRGTKDVDPALVRRRVPFHAGQRFDPKVEDRLRTDLTSLDVFRTIRIVEGDHLDANGQLPITIEVSEKPHHFVGLSASYGTTEGGAVTAYWGHRNLFGGAEHLRLDATVARLFENDLGKLDYGVGVTFTKPSVWTAQDDLTLQLKALQENPDAYSRRGVVAAAGLQRHISPQFTIKAGLSGEVSRITDFFGTQNYYLLGVPIEADWDTTDSKLDPRTGFRVALVGEPVASFGPTPSFFSTSATASAYYPLDEAKKYVLAGKVQIASDLGTSLRGIPAYRRQFAGGGGTVRGYSYQALSPTAANGQIIGGRSLFDASAELRVHVTDTIGVVPFVDIGNAYAASFPDFSGLHVGAGIGLRYFTIVGPLRLDIAFPLNPRRGDPRFAFYVGLGQSF